MAKMKGLGSERKVLELSLIGCDERYQRGVQNTHATIAENFNPDAVGVLIVSLRPDRSYVVIDGLQRLTALRKLGIEKWKCEVVRCDNLEYEAEIFRLINKGRKSLSSRALFKAALVAKDPIALGVVEVVEAAGLQVDLTSGNNRADWPRITCAGMLYREYAKSNGKETLTKALGLIVKTWPTDPQGLHETIIGSLCLLCRSRQFDESRFTATVGAKSPKMIRQAAESGLGGNSRYAMAADVMVRLYNARLKVGSEKTLKLFTDRSAPQAEEQAG